jgi:hypothetical protein
MSKYKVSSVWSVSQKYGVSLTQDQWLHSADKLTNCYDEVVSDYLKVRFD